MPKNLIEVKGVEIKVITKNNMEYISLTGIAKYKNQNRPDDIIRNWLRNKNTLVFLSLWEKINNSNFKPVEFDGFISEAGLNSFSTTVTELQRITNLLGIVSKKGRYGGTYAQKDIAFEFASWISSEFKLYLIKEFQRLKEKEIKSQSLEWNLTRLLTKINYRVHTDSIKENLIPKKIDKKYNHTIYAQEADVLNMALFNKTAKQWGKENKDKEGNMRDYADIRQLICLSNLESINAELIREGIDKENRLRKLNLIAINQMKSLVRDNTKLLN